MMTCPLHCKRLRNQVIYCAPRKNSSGTFIWFRRR